MGNGGVPANHKCPSHAPVMVQANPWLPASQELAPMGARAINLCRYAGANSLPRLGLIGNDFLAARKQINGLIREFDALAPFPLGVFHCPVDAGAAVLATLVYPRSQEVRIRVDLQGCNPVSNGDLLRTGANLDGLNPRGPRLLAKLKRLTDRLHVYH